MALRELKIECECRKPKPGMILQAAKDFNIDLSKSYMVGDGENDILAGKAAGCKTVLIQEPATCNGDVCTFNAPKDYGQDKMVTGLLEFVKYI